MEVRGAKQWIMPTRGVILGKRLLTIDVPPEGRFYHTSAGERDSEYRGKDCDDVFCVEHDGSQANADFSGGTAMHGPQRPLHHYSVVDKVTEWFW